MYEIQIGRIGKTDENSRNALFKINKRNGNVFLWDFVRDKWIPLGTGKDTTEILPILFRQQGPLNFDDLIPAENL